MGKERAVLKDQYCSAVFGWAAGEVRPVEHDATGVGRDDPRDDREQRGLATTRRAEHREHFASDGEVDGTEFELGIRLRHAVEHQTHSHGFAARVLRSASATAESTRSTTATGYAPSRPSALNEVQIFTGSVIG